MASTEHEPFDSRILAFEQSWQQGHPPVIRDYLPREFDSAEQLALLSELVCIDLEYRWRFAQEEKTAEPPKTLKDYVQTHPELGTRETLSLELIGEEYRVRRLWGDRPDRETYLSDFPDRAAEIRTILKQIDRELLAETTEEQIFIPGVESAPFADAFDGQIDPKAPLAYSDYKLQKLIGAGLMGRVYRAWQQSLERPVAVKYLRKSFLRDRESVDRFLSEARTVARLQHRHIIGIHGLGRTPQGGYFIVMDWIEGSDLGRVLDRKEPVSLAEAVRWTGEAFAGIQKAHDLNIFHCDLKPGNILLDQEGQVRITDFGLSRSLADQTQTQHRIEGTAPFMAPEQVSPHWGPINARTDIYGLGAVLYTLLTGVPPHHGRTLADVLAKVVSANSIIPPKILRPDLPASVNAVCLKSLAKSPADRFATAVEFSEHLQACNVNFADTQGD